MKNSFKISLLSLIACVFTVGGVFGAWVFGEGSNSASVETNTTVGTLPSDYWYFDSVTLTFSCDNSATPTMTGTFGETTDTLRSISVQQGSAIDYNSYLESVETPICSDSNYVFSHWGYYNNDNLTHFNFDVGLDVGTTLYAQYVPKTNPAIYLTNSDTPLGYFFLNTAYTGGIEYMLNNFVVSQSSSERGASYVIKYDSDGDGELNEFHCKHENSTDTVYIGTYNIFFRPSSDHTDFNSNEWKTYGAYQYFQRQYRFSLIGNPVKTWDTSQNLPVLGYDSHTGEDTDATKTYQYSVSKIYFTDEVWNEGAVSYDFKAVETYFGLWPHVETPGNVFILKPGTNTTTNADNLVAPAKACLYNVSATVVFTKHETIGSYYIYNFYPTSITINLTPCEYNVTYYTESKTLTESVAYGDTLNACLTDEELYKKVVNNETNTIQYVTAWVDKYTGKTFEVANLASEQIAGNYHLEPVYSGVITPTTYNYYTGYENDAWVAGITKHVYNTDGLYPALESYTLADSDFVVGNYDDSVYNVDTNTWYTSFDEDPLTKAAVKTGDASVSGTINYYVCFYYSDDTVRLPNTEISDSGDHIIYQDVSANDTYSYGTRKVVLNDQLEEQDASSQTPVTITTAGRYMFHVKNKSVVGTPVIADKTTYIDTSYSFKYIYLDIGKSGWGSDGAWFWAHIWGTSGTKDLKMNLISGTLYCCQAPSGSYGNILFCRANPANINMVWGEGNVWNQTGNLTYSSSSNCFNMEGFSYGTWTKKEMHFTTASKDNGIISAASNNTISSTVYLETGPWNVGSAWFAAYFWNGNSHTWRKMYDLDGDGTYVCDIPSGYTNMLFCRMNSSKSDLCFDYYSDNNNVDYVWNQTDNLTIDGTCFEITNPWGDENNGYKATGTWSDS